MNNKNELVLLTLDKIKQVLQQKNLWSDGKKRPNDNAFLSTTPFFMDTMEFEQWLEFVLIPNFYALIEQNQPLPKNVLIHPYAQEFYRGRWGEFKDLINVLREFDELFK